MSLEEGVPVVHSSQETGFYKITRITGSYKGEV